MSLPQTLRHYGQSVWLDDLEREIIVSGQLRQYIAQDNLRGGLSNFTSLEQAIRGKNYYRDFRAMERQPEIDVRSHGASSAQAVYEYIIVRAK